MGKEPSKHVKVCGRHFEEKDFFPSKLFSDHFFYFYINLSLEIQTWTNRAGWHYFKNISLESDW